MQHRKIGLGTAAIGRPQYINIRPEKQPADFSLPEFRQNGLQMLEDAYALGVRFFDASPGYGLAESLLVEWLEKKNDPDITVATKWGLSYTAAFDPKAKVHEVKEHSLTRLEAQWEYSKKLLPHLRLYQIHSATHDTGVLRNKAILERLHRIKKENNIVIGLTSTGVRQREILTEALGIEIDGEPLFGAFQVTYNIMEQSVFDLKALLSDSNSQLIVKESLANGRLLPNNAYPQHSGLYRQLAALAAKYNVGPDAIALRFCLESLPQAICLSGASTAAQLRSNLAADSFALDGSEMEMLRAHRVAPAAYWEQRKQMPWQ